MSNHEHFIALQVALEAAAAALRLLETIPGRHRSLADQCGRAITSTALNLSEGRGRVGRDRLHHYRIAFASAKEAKTALQLIRTLQLVPDERAAAVFSLVDRTCALTCRVIQAELRR